MVLGGLWLRLWQTRWRALGPVIAAAGLLVSGEGSRPDVLVERSGRHPAALEEDCRLADIVIAPFSVGKACSAARVVVDRHELQAEGAHDLYSRGSRSGARASRRRADGVLGYLSTRSPSRQRRQAKSMREIGECLTMVVMKAMTIAASTAIRMSDA